MKFVGDNVFLLIHIFSASFHSEKTRFVALSFLSRSSSASRVTLLHSEVATTDAGTPAGIA